MRCRRVDNLLERYADGRVGTSLARRIEVHLQGCEGCAAALREVIALAERLQAFPAATAPDDLESRIMAAIAREAALRDSELASDRRAEVNPLYRRLGLSFVLTAALLAGSLFIPHGAYFSLVGSPAVATYLGPERGLKETLARAGGVVRGTLYPGSAPAR